MHAFLPDAGTLALKATTPLAAAADDDDDGDGDDDDDNYSAHSVTWRIVKGGVGWRRLR